MERPPHALVGRQHRPQVPVRQEDEVRSRGVPVIGPAVRLHQHVWPLGLACSDTIAIARTLVMLHIYSDACGDASVVPACPVQAPPSAPTCAPLFQGVLRQGCHPERVQWLARLLQEDADSVEQPGAARPLRPWRETHRAEYSHDAPLTRDLSHALTAKEDACRLQL